MQIVIFLNEISKRDSIDKKEDFMASIKQDTKENVREHSQAKLDFYQNYLIKYLMILLSDPYTNEINIYDIFCGIGIYEDGNHGSPIIAIKIIKDLLQKYPQKNINLIINDIDKSKIDFVSQYIDNNYKNVCRVNSHNLDATEMLKIVNQSIYESKKGTKNLVFIDPYGYKEIYKNDILKIMDSKKSEIIIFLPIAQMYRFSNAALTDEENNSYRHLRRFIQDFFDVTHPIHDENLDNQFQYIDYIKEAFSFDDKYYSASYRIQRDSRNYYSLFFITNHIYGLDRIIDTKWKLDSNCGEGFKKIKTEHLFTGMFEETDKENCLEKLESSLKEYLVEYRTNNEIYEFTLIAGFLPKHSNEILKDLFKNHKLEFDRDVRKNSFYLNYGYYKNKDIKYKAKIIE